MDIKYLRGLGQGRYITINNGISLFDNINKYDGTRYQLEKLSLYLSKIFYSFFIGSPNSINQVEKYLAVLVKIYGDIDKGFLLNTAWYKDSYCVGSVCFSNTTVFFKFFKIKGLSQQEAKRQKIISKIYGSSFNYSEVKYVDDELIVYKLIPNVGEQCTAEYMRTAAIRMYSDFLSTSDKDCSLAQLSERVLISIGNITISDELSSQILTVLNKLSTFENKLPLLYCHGDYTTWNTVIDKNAPYKKYLIDYESCEERVLYTDLFHLFTQKACLEDNTLDLLNIITALSNDLHLTQVEILKYYSAYLLEELLVNLGEWENGKNHAQLFNLIEYKFKLLVECYANFQDKE